MLLQNMFKGVTFNINLSWLKLVHLDSWDLFLYGEVGISFVDFLNRNKTYNTSISGKKTHTFINLNITLLLCYNNITIDIKMNHERFRCLNIETLYCVWKDRHTQMTFVCVTWHFEDHRVLDSKCSDRKKYKPVLLSLDLVVWYTRNTLLDKYMCRFI